MPPSRESVVNGGPGRIAAMKTGHTEYRDLPCREIEAPPGREIEAPPGRSRPRAYGLLRGRGLFQQALREHPGICEVLLVGVAFLEAADQPERPEGVEAGAGKRAFHV